MTANDENRALPRRVSALIFGILLAGFALMALGAQLAFLATLPNASSLLRDPASLWLVFSTWPGMSFGLFSLLILSFYSMFEWLRQRWKGISGMVRAIRTMSRPAIVAAIGATVFLSPLLIAIPLPVVGDLAIVFTTAALAALLLDKALARNIPLPVVGVVGAFSLGFLGTVMMPGLKPMSFSCAQGSVELRSGEVVACTTLMRFDRKPLLLIEDAQVSRLVMRSDIEREKFNEAIGIR